MAEIFPWLVNSVHLGHFEKMLTSQSGFCMLAAYGQQPAPGMGRGYGMGAYGQYGAAPGQPPAQPQGYGAVATPGATPGTGYGYGGKMI